jgi:hypothetical protein
MPPYFPFSPSIPPYLLPHTSVYALVVTYVYVYVLILYTYVNIRSQTSSYVVVCIPTSPSSSLLFHPSLSLRHTILSSLSLSLPLSLSVSMNVCVCLSLTHTHSANRWTERERDSQIIFSPLYRCANSATHIHSLHRSYTHTVTPPSLLPGSINKKVYRYVWRGE